MKMILTIVNDPDSDVISQALVQSRYRVTRVASTGGFLRRGSSTLLIGVEDEQVDRAIEIIRQSVSPSPDPSVHRVTLFVLNVAGYTQI